MPCWMLKAVAVTPGLLVSTVITLMVGGLLPHPAGLVLFTGGLTMAVVFLTRWGEAAAATLLWFSRPARAIELELLTGALTRLCRAGLGPPVVRLRVAIGQPVIAARGLGRGTVIISTGLLDALEDGSLPQDQAAAVIAHAAGLTTRGHVRHDPLIEFWSLPWNLLTLFVDAAAAVGRQLPGTSLAWRLRVVVVTIAVVHAVQEHQPWLAVTIAGIGTASYAIPWSQHRWRQELDDLGDAAVCHAGLAPAMAAFLRRCPRTPATRRRLHHLQPPTRTTPHLGLVHQSRSAGVHE